MFCIAKVNLKKGKLIEIGTNFTKITNPKLTTIYSAQKGMVGPEVRQNTKQGFHMQNYLLLQSKEKICPTLSSSAPHSTKGMKRAPRDKEGGPLGTEA